MRHSRHGVVEEVAIMIRNGASEKTVDDYIEKLWKNAEITSRVYELLVTMNICRQRYIGGTSLQRRQNTSIFYAPYDVYKIIKGIVGAYDLRH